MPGQIKPSDKIRRLTDSEELEKRGYILASTIGDGTYSKVKSAFSKKHNHKVAIKIIDKRKTAKNFLYKFLPRELDVIKKIHHPNIIRLYEILEFNNKVYIVMELAGHGDLLDYIRLRGALPEEKAKYMFQQLVDAVEYLHGMNIVHRDLKCENVLLTKDNMIKLSDFGFARFIGDDELSKTYCGSAAYAAPEILKGTPYLAPAYDVWSLGVILFSMVFGLMPFDDTNVKKMIKDQQNKKIRFPTVVKVSQQCRDLISRMLEPVAHKRATINEVQQSDWLQTIKPKRLSATSPDKKDTDNKERQHKATQTEWPVTYNTNKCRFLEPPRVS